MAKRRILDKLKLTEISGVDRPCQQGATVALFKRAPVSQLEKFHAAHDRLACALSKYNPNHDPATGRFASAVGGISSGAARAYTHGHAIARDINSLRNSKTYAETGALLDRLKTNFAALKASLKSTTPHIQDLYNQALELFARLQTIFQRKEQAMSKFYDEDNQDDVISKADAAELMGAVTDLEARVQDLTKRFEQAEREPKQIVVNKSASGPNDFNIKVSEIRKRDGCSRTEAMQKARREAPESFAAFNGTD